MHRIVVLGAGYTGMIAAIRVARRTRRRDTQVTLVNPSDRFTERLRMHQTATGQTLTDRRIPDLLRGTGVEFVRARAERIDTVRREVSAGGRTIGYDTLVYAIGSVADTVTVEGAQAYAYTLNTVETAGRLANVLAGRPDAVVAVVGGGLTGVEAATEIAERHPAARVVLLSRAAPGPLMSARARAHLDRALTRLRVEVRAGVDVVAVRPGAVELAGGEVVAADATLWTTGFTASPLAAEAGLTVDEHGRIVVDATLRSVSHPDVVAIGDAAAIRQPWGTVHGTCQSGIPSGAHAADSIARVLAGKAAKPFRFGYIHQPVSLGRKDAVIQFTHADDTPRRWFLSGRAAVIYKELVTSSPLPSYRMSRRFTVPAAFLSSRG
ncbi:NAD(P)/FAD-dependent oxidoreductase [Dactylosporangium siamense]|uniref:Oxidoreductase n=1 Tax=Dactylosporangium siamense TaxID=685454 RepID=A0A919UHV0_9ACTN|nr:FAD-dependent oxidoreductase [Dactylosporangium siamense]GIG51940.1 oxidoreductase [Dactylosporangium siamense]